MEKLFVILEVKEIDGGEIKAGINHHYKPIDAKNDGHCDEELWLQPERVIPASRLRYQLPCPGERFFHVREGWKRCTGPGWDSYQVLILDPPEPVDDFEKWVEEMPYRPDLDFQNQKMKAWFRRMPRGK